ncbi:MAG: zinc ribbon domain-containing protein [Dehalococcoidia bacterium]|nr:zinc ribbon domain-containing protein [Dehalococcoidia bacterium]
MPIYEYVCDTCKSRFELMRPFSRANEGASCPKCQGKAERVISRCFAVSKGEGGTTAPVAGTGSSCGSCSAGSCSGCSH